MKHERFEHPALTLVGVSARITPDLAMEQIGSLWGRFMADDLLQTIDGRLDPHTIVAAYTDYESDHTGAYTLMLGAPVRPDAEAAPSLELRHFAAQTCARLRAEGKVPDVVQQTWQAVYRSELPRAFTVDFERYDVRQMGQHASLELFIAVRPNANSDA